MATVKKVRIKIDGQEYELVGEKGADGRNGVDGRNGADGKNGTNGKDADLSSLSLAVSGNSLSLKNGGNTLGQPVSLPSGGGGSGTPVDAYTKGEADNKFATKDEVQSGGGSAPAQKTYKKFVVVAVNGQSNSVGYDESPLTMFDVARDANRIFQYSDSLKPLTYMAESIQMMNAVGINGKTAQANDRMTKDAWYEEDRATQAKTKGIHLPLANLICDVIPDDYGVIIVPGSVGGMPIANFQKSAGRSSAAGVTIQTNIYTEFMKRLKAAMDLNENNIFCGIIWCQGENNCGNTGDSYVTSLRQLITDTNNELQGYAKRSAHGSITEKDWYFYEWPLYYKQRDTGGILNALKLFFGNRYVPIPDETPFNATQFTSSNMNAHYADNAFRKTIAPRVFNAMQQNGCFLSNSHDNNTDTDLSGIEEGHENLVEEVSRLKSLVNALQVTVQNMGGVIERVADWVKVTADRFTKAFGDDVTVEDGKVIPNNKKTGYLLPEDVTKVRFRYTATNAAGSNLGYFICYANTSDLTDVRAIDFDFNTTQAFQHQWVKANSGYNVVDGDLWSDASNNDVYEFTKHHDLLITAEKLENGTVKLTTENGFTKTLQKPANSTNLEVRFGFGGLNGFCGNNFNWYDIEVYE